MSDPPPASEANTATLAAPAIADRFSIGVPGDWMVLPLDLDPRTRDQRIKRLVEDRVGKQDKLAPLRRQTVVQLRKSAAETVNAGGFFAAMHSRIADGRPMSASVTVSLLPLTKDADGNVLSDAEEIAATLAAGAGSKKGIVLEHSVTDLPIGRAARLRRRTSSGIHGTDGREVESESVQFYVPFPDFSRTLALVFSTPILPLADAYAELFDTMATTAKWIWTTDKGPNQ